MQLQRFRFTVRRLLILVAMVAMSLGGYVYALRLAHLSEDYRKRAVYHEFAMLLRVQVCKGFSGKPLRPTPSQMTILAAYHRNLQQKYEHAARIPWWPIEPDPPEPEGASLLRFGS